MPSPYGPDRSLPIAIAVLVGGSLLVAAFVYLLTSSTGTLIDGRRAQMAEDQSPTRVPSTAPRRSLLAARSASPTDRGRTSSPFVGHAPPWAGSGATESPPQSAPPDLYALRPDMSHADLGTPSNGSSPEMTGSGAARTETDRPAGGGARAGSTPLTADLGTESSGAETSWHSEASTLGRQARALSGALAHLDRTTKSANESGRAGSNPASGNASTASGGSGSHGPGGSPDPPPDPEQVPVDGGLGWLAAAGAAYAANRLRKQRGGGEAEEEA